MLRQRALVTFVALAALAIALPAPADVGSFQSFTATTTHPTKDSIRWDFTLVTEGVAGPTKTQTVLAPVRAVLEFWRVDAANPIPPSNSTSFLLSRTDPTANTFTASFTATGLDPTIDYKWGATAVYYNSPTIGATSLLGDWAFSFLLNTGLPFIYSFVNSGWTITNISNAFPSETPGGVEGALRLGRVVAAGRGIPTTSAVGVVLLGLLMMGAGILVFRRS